MEYDLYSTDWVNIELLHSEHLVAETLYAEQMNRWGLQYGRAWGMVQVGEEDFQVHGSSSDYEVSLRQCKAITRRGYIIDMDAARPPLTLQGSNDNHRETLVPIYLGVGMEKESANAGSSQTGALLDRPALRWKYVLTVEPDSARFDWLQIGRLRRDGQRFIRDENYIPQCVHLKSSPASLRIALDITQAAEQALTALERSTGQRADSPDISPLWPAIIGTLINAMSPAAILVDRDAHPRQYLQRLAAVLRACGALLPLLEATNSNWTQANDRIQRALKALRDGTLGERPRAQIANGYSEGEHAPVSGMDLPVIPGGMGITAPPVSGGFAPEEMRPGIFWWDIFDLIRQAFQALALLFEGLTPNAARPGQIPTDSGGGTIIKRPPQTGFQPVKRT